MVSDSWNFWMDNTSSKVFSCYNLTRCCFDQWWPSKKNSSIPLNDNVLIGHCWHICSSSCTASQYQRNLRDSLWGKLGHVVENSPEMPFSRENIALPWKIGSSRVNQIKAWQFVLQGDLLSPEVLLYSNGIVGSTKLWSIYPLTVGSFATIMQNLPWMSPTPVMMPPELTSSLPYSS